MHKVVPRDFVCSPSVHFPWPTLQHWINPCEVVPGRKSYSVAYFDQITVLYTSDQYCFTLLRTGLACAVWMSHACSNRQQLGTTMYKDPPPL